MQMSGGKVHIFSYAAVVDCFSEALQWIFYISCRIIDHLE